MFGIFYEIFSLIHWFQDSVVSSGGSSSRAVVLVVIIIPMCIFGCASLFWMKVVRICKICSVCQTFRFQDDSHDDDDDNDNYNVDKTTLIMPIKAARITLV